MLDRYPLTDAELPISTRDDLRGPAWLLTLHGVLRLDDRGSMKTQILAAPGRIVDRRRRPPVGIRDRRVAARGDLVLPIRRDARPASPTGCTDTFALTGPDTQASPQRRPESGALLWNWLGTCSSVWLRRTRPSAAMASRPTGAHESSPTRSSVQRRRNEQSSRPRQRSEAPASVRRQQPERCLRGCCSYACYSGVPG
jgi:hypothetical protein